MSPIIYDISLVVGTAMIAAGAYVLWGVGMALLVTGATIVALTMFAGYLMAKGK
jgi:hypothetical protein